MARTQGYWGFSWIYSWTDFCRLFKICAYCSRTIQMKLMGEGEMLSAQDELEKNIAEGHVEFPPPVNTSRGKFFNCFFFYSDCRRIEARLRAAPVSDIADARLLSEGCKGNPVNKQDSVRWSLFHWQMHFFTIFIEKTYVSVAWNKFRSSLISTHSQLTNRGKTNPTCTIAYATWSTLIDN